MGAQFDLGVEKVFKPAQEQRIRYPRLRAERRGRPNMVNDEAGFFKKLTIGGRAKPPNMRFVHGAFPLVIPAAAQEHEDDAVMADVGRAGQDDGAGLHEGTKPEQDRSRVTKMLQNLAHEQNIKGGGRQVQRQAFDVPDNDLVELGASLSSRLFAKFDAAGPPTLPFSERRSGSIAIAAAKLQ